MPLSKVPEDAGQTGHGLPPDLAAFVNGGATHQRVRWDLRLGPARRRVAQRRRTHFKIPLRRED